MTLRELILASTVAVFATPAAAAAQGPGPFASIDPDWDLPRVVRKVDSAPILHAVTMLARDGGYEVRLPAAQFDDASHALIPKAAADLKKLARGWSQRSDLRVEITAYARACPSVAASLHAKAVAESLGAIAQERITLRTARGDEGAVLIRFSPATHP